jgi:hypothetical protein
MKRSSLIVEGKKKVGKRSAQERSALDDRFHRTTRASRARPTRSFLQPKVTRPRPRRVQAQS